MVSKHTLKQLLRVAVGAFLVFTPLIGEAAQKATPSLLYPLTDYDMVEEEGRTYVSLEAVKKASFYTFKEEKGTVTVFVPTMKNLDDPSTKGIELVIPNYGKGTSISLPTKMIGGHAYIDKALLGPGVGVAIEQPKSVLRTLLGTGKSKEVLVLRNLDGRVTMPEKKALSHLVWAFDPIGTVESAYTTKLVKDGEHIISPSWFELDKKGQIGGEKLSLPYVNAYEEHGFHVWPLITNQFDPKLTHDIVSNQKDWELYKEKLVANALVYGYDGYNFDFENVNFEDRDKLTSFVTYLGKELSGVGLYTSMDVTGYSDSGNWSRVYDRPNLAKAVNYIVLMAYDETWSSSKVGGPVASLPWVRKHAEKMLTEVPANQLVLGIPFYMRDWKEIAKVPTSATKPATNVAAKSSTNVAVKEPPNVSADAKATTDVKVASKLTPIEKPFGEVKGKTLSIRAVPALLEKYHIEPTWKDDLKAHYFTYVDEEGYRHAVWMEDKDSLREKILLARELELAGVAAWRKGFEDGDTWSHIDAAFQEKITKDKSISGKDEKNSAKSTKNGTMSK